MLPQVRSPRTTLILCLAAGAMVAMACGSSTPVSPTATTITAASTTAPITPATVDPPIAAANTLSSPEVLVGAGDISQCGLDGAAQTASLMNGLLQDARATGFTLGDNTNDDGSREKVLNCLDTTWGAFKGRLMPSPGNHDYEADATNPFYYDYFGAAAGPKPLGYYSYDRGNWHILSLNSELPDGPMRQAQLDWMAADLRFVWRFATTSTRDDEREELCQAAGESWGHLGNDARWRHVLHDAAGGGARPGRRHAPTPSREAHARLPG